MSISGNMVGSYSQIGKTFILTDADGNEITGVVVDQETIFTANAAEDIREGKVAATDVGVVTGTAFIPNYKTYTGVKIIPNGSDLCLPLQDGGYNYTKLQAIMCSFNTNSTNSVSAEQIAVEDKVFAVRSTEALSDVVKDHDGEFINFGITNTSGGICLIRYFLYKELY